MKKFFIIVYLAVLVLTGQQAIAASPKKQDTAPMGSIKEMAGTVSVTRRNQTVPVTVGTRIFSGDILKTGKDGAMGIILQDNTIFGMGPESELTVDEFLFDPGAGKFSLVARMIRGTFSYLSGMIGKLSPESARIETPSGIVGVRGTHFLAKVE